MLLQADEAQFQLGEAGGRGLKTRAVDVSFLM